MKLAKWKTLMLACAVWAGAAAAGAPSAHADASVFGTEAKVQINDSLIAFQEAGPLLTDDGDLLVPVRPIADQLNLLVDWNPAGGEVELTLHAIDRSIRLVTGSADAAINGKPVTMASPALFYEGHVYVPVRFITETLGYMLSWDSRNGIAIICKDGKDHAPAWIAPVPAAAPPAPAADRIGGLIETAKSLTGIRYAWGGTTTAGFDCSGFVNYVYSQYGINLPRTSREMLASSGTPAASSDLRQGDLVFFTIGRISHVGIYLGNDAFISATSTHGIHIDSLTSSYWGPKFVGAKRVI
ncbi:NlpC/P60 family protein [Paenibacillus chartarius]|uniref:NlpC/P60 family protein n=1 Tax=Paenibacillus chartarius TaxID=747481 RepID=A0ABV6DMZ5_9BACL